MTRPSSEHQTKSSSHAPIPTRQPGQRCCLDGGTSITGIVSDGDIVLDIQDHRLGFSHRYRCSRDMLRRESDYFDMLLKPDRFSEGSRIQGRLEELSQEYGSASAVPFEALPVVTVSEIGPISGDLATIKMVICLLLQALHGLHPGWPLAGVAARRESLSFLAQLVVIADRLSALRIVRKHVAGYWMPMIHWENKMKTARSTQAKELYIRQRLLVALLLDFPEPMRLYSSILIVNGSERWRNPQMFNCEGDREEVAAWYMLPRGLEGTPDSHHPKFQSC